VPGDRLQRILESMQATGSQWSAGELWEACPALVGVNGAGVMLRAGDVQRGSLGATGEVSTLIEELQFTLGEGPCVDAYQQDCVVTEADLADPAIRRWPAFAPPVLRAGVRAIFGFPLRVGTVRLGALDLYRDQPGPLTAEQHADALVVADVTARWVLDAQASAPAGAVAEELQSTADFHYIVHNAAGIVSVQEEITVAEALVRLRALAYSSDRPLAEVAHAVVGRTLRLP
jgi:hypothetical protein